MKKFIGRLGESLLITVIVSGVLFAFHGLCARFLQHMPLSTTMMGGECTEELGFGWLITKFYPMSSGEAPAPSSEPIVSFSPSSLIRGALAVFVIAAAVVFIVGAIKAAKAKKKDR